MPADGKRFLALDSCRGLCAVAVMLFHLDAYTHFYGWPVVRNSWVAVDFFFALSGFVIASAYHAKLRTLADMGRFAIRRFGRLYPLHFAVLAVYVGIELYRLWFLRAADAFTDNTSIPAAFENLFLVQGFTADHETWNYPAWSVSVELWVNFAFAALAIVFRRWLFACALLLMVAGAAILLGGNELAAAISAVQAGALLDAIQSAFEFLLGFLAFLIFSAAKTRGYRPPAMAELIVLLLAAWVFGYTDSIPPLALPFIFSSIVLVLAFEAGPLSALLRRSPLTKLGTWSYSVYLTHSLYLMGLETVVFAIAGHLGVAASVQVNGDDILTLGGPWAMDGAAFLCVCAAILGSAITYRFIEEPARLYFNRISNGVEVRRKIISVVTP